MTTNLRLIFVAVSLALASITQADEPPIRYAFQVFQLSGGFSQKTSLKKGVWKGGKKAWEKIKGEVVLFDSGEFRSGKDRLVMRSKSCFWNDQMLTFEEGHEAKLPEKKIKMIYSPNLVRKEKELVRLKITSKRPYQYMKPHKDGFFKLEEIKLPTGLDIEIKAHKTAKDVYEIDYLELDLRAVNQREPANGTTLPVGKPILSESEYILKLRVREFHSYGIVLQPKGSDSLIIIRFEVDDEN